MIPSTNNQLLVAEDWKKIYQSFRNADFTSYDFDTLRRTMITYLRENYPEEFNDYINSSEYIALIDLIAFLGQNLSFRVDLNARDNFLETAERRDSILRLAQLISYNPKRNVPANGFLKITSISTTESVFDSNGTNLANNIIGWNDPTNSNWYQQFITIMNAALSSPSQFGKPVASSLINGINTEQYRINSNNTGVPVYGFSKNVAGTSINFELVSSTFSGKTYIYEEPPQPGNQFGIIYQNDNQGSGSKNTGFFIHFRQGALNSANFNVSAPVPNEIVGLNVRGVNDTDVWLWQLNENGTQPVTLWTKVSATTGNNVIYNSVQQSERNIYTVLSKLNDQVDLSFADGSFGNLPKGGFTVYYRQSNGLVYSIKPEQMSNIIVRIPYNSKSGQSNTLNIVLSLQYTVNNSAAAETDADIKLKAPQTYYTQNRMITGEDYNIAPLNVSPDIIKVKSINRISSGISKYYELSDVSGAYSSTNIFADDGILYKHISENTTFNFSFVTRNEIFSVVKLKLAPIINSSELKSFYFDADNFPRKQLTTNTLVWNQSNVSTNETRGYFYVVSNTGNIPIPVGTFGSGNNVYIKPGALIKFEAPSGFYFTSKGKLTTTASDTTISYFWSSVANVAGDGYANGNGNLSNGTGPVILTRTVPTGAIATEVIPVFENILPFSVETEIVNLCQTKRNFGLTYNLNYPSNPWQIVLDTNINLVDSFSLVHQGSVTNTNLDSSWLVAFEWTGKEYTVKYRQTEYIFESQEKTAFFVDNTSKNYDYVTGTVVKDKIDILSINKAPNSNDALGVDYVWQIDSAIEQSDGFIEPKKVLVSFYDFSGDGQIDDPDMFTEIVAANSYIYFKYDSKMDTYNLYDGDIEVYDGGVSLVDGGLYYFVTDDVIKSYNKTINQFTVDADYIARIGRSNLKFQYLHNSGRERRLDPSKMNIIDIFILGRNYDVEYRTWLTTGAGSEPLPPTTESLESNYSSVLEPIKAISDELVYHPAKYKVLFGSQASVNLQAVFKAVQSASSVESITSLQTRILTAINDFFSIDNWDFGQTFNFGELSAYVMNIMTPDIVNFVIVPKNANNSFGSLFQVSCQGNEIFVNGATVNEIQILSSLTSSELNTTNLITSV
jgi:hypothetical protein